MVRYTFPVRLFHPLHSSRFLALSKAPASLNGVVLDPSTGAVTATRPICMYPNVAHYNGHGPTNEASNFSCRRSNGDE